MHNAMTAEETLDFLWDNYLTLSEKVDLEAMPPDDFYALNPTTPVRPFRIAAWLSRQSYYLAAWNLWEYYSRCLCKALVTKTKKLKNESVVDWISNSLAANCIVFTDRDWFQAAYSLRNLIAHNGARVDNDKGRTLLERARSAYSEIQTWKDGYIEISHDHLADLSIKIEDFIRATASCWPN
jgi:hypothetical protein